MTRVLPLTVAQVAARLSLAERTVRDQLAKGVMIGVRPGRDWLVSPRDVDRYAREHQGKPGRRAAGRIGTVAMGEAHRGR